MYGRTVIRETIEERRRYEVARTEATEQRKDAKKVKREELQGMGGQKTSRVAWIGSRMERVNRRQSLRGMKRERERGGEWKRQSLRGMEQERK